MTALCVYVACIVVFALRALRRNVRIHGQGVPNAIAPSIEETSPLLDTPSGNDGGRLWKTRLHRDSGFGSSQSQEEGGPQHDVEAGRFFNIKVPEGMAAKAGEQSRKHRRGLLSALRRQQEGEARPE
jgi:hypothetical protein